MTTTNKFKKFLIAILSLIVAVSLTLFCACENTEDNNDDSTNNDDTKAEETVTDYQKLANGDFEFYTTDGTTFPYSSSVKWTRSNDKSLTSAISSTVTSGIIDTEDEEYADLSATSRPVLSSTENETTYFNPRTPSYYGLVKNEYDKEDEDKRVNPNVAGTKVLMINNKSTVNGQGTAQKFTSSSTLTVPQNSFAVLSLWVNTYALKTVVTDKLASKEFGAYVALTNSVGSVEYSDLAIDNINTDGKWVNVNIYVMGSKINSTTYGLSLGLGKGSKNNKDGYVEGFAYFDNVTFTTYSQKEFEDKFMSNPPSVDGNLSVDKKDDTATYKFSTVSKTGNYVANGDKADYVDEATATAKYSTYNVKLTYSSNINYNLYTDVPATPFKWNKNVTNKKHDFETGNTRLYKNINDLSDTEKALFDSKVDFEKMTAYEGIDAKNGYVALMDFKNPSSATFTSAAITVPSESYKVVSFFTQSKVTNSSSSVAKVFLKETADGKDAVSLFTDITSVTEEGDYGYWTYYTVAVYNPTDDDASFTINMTFGMGEGEYADMPSRDLPTGYAVIAGFATADVTEDVYNNILTSSNVNKQTIYGKYVSFEEETETTSYDEYNVTPDVTQQSVIEFKPTDNVPSFTFSGDSSKVVKGIVNSKYVNADNTYGKNNVAGIENIDVLSTLTTLRSDGITYNNHAQAIVLTNKEATSSAFITSKSTFAANSYTTIVVRVRATGNAIANVYLSGTDYNETTKKHELIAIKGDNDKSAQITAKATASSHKYDGKWTEICFYVATGNEAIDYRVEIWNGTRDGSTNSAGTIYIDNVYVADSTANAFAFDKAQYADEYEALGSEYKFTSFEYTRVATVKYTNEDGDEAEKTRTFPATEVFAGNDLIKFVSYETIDVDNVIDETVSEEDSSTEDTTTEETDPYKASLSQNLPLLIISGIIALALIVVIVVVLIKGNKKKVVADSKKKEEYYDRNVRDIAMAKILEKKSKINVEKDDDDAEYDYEEAAKIGEEEVVEETEVTEEVTEEVIDMEDLEKGNEVLNETDDNNDNN